MKFIWKILLHFLLLSLNIQNTASMRSSDNREGYVLHIREICVTGRSPSTFKHIEYNL